MKKHKRHVQSNNKVNKARKITLKHQALNHQIQNKTN